LPSDALFDDAAAGIGVDKPLPGSPDRFGQAGVRDPFAACEFRKKFGFENPQVAPLCVL
jgi:hypothetical protein